MDAPGILSESLLGYQNILIVLKTLHQLNSLDDLKITILHFCFITNKNNSRKLRKKSDSQNQNTTLDIFHSKIINQIDR